VPGQNHGRHPTRAPTPDTATNAIATAPLSAEKPQELLWNSDKIREWLFTHLNAMDDSLKHLFAKPPTPMSVLKLDAMY
jgi:hypothetical protein